MLNGEVLSLPNVDANACNATSATLFPLLKAMGSTARHDVGRVGADAGDGREKPVQSPGADVYGKSALDATQTGRRIDGKEAGDLSSQSPRIYTGSGPVSYRRDKNTTASATLPETSGSVPTARVWWVAKSSSTGPAMRPRSPPPLYSVRTALMCRAGTLSMR